MSLAETRALLDLAHARLLAWSGELLAEADLPDMTVFGDFLAPGAPPPAGGSLVLYPYRLVPWPKRVESSSPGRMLNPRAPSAFPGPWSTIAAELGAALDAVLPRSADGRVLPRPPVARLPEPLAAWYRDRGEPWLIGDDARLPSLGWRSPFVVRVYYLALASPAAGSRTPGVSALGALAVAINNDRTLPVEVPPDPVAVEVAGFVQALAACLPGGEAPALREAADAVCNPATWPLTLVPFPEIESEDVADLMRALGRPLQPVLHLAVQVPLGAGVVFEPSVQARMSTRAAPASAP